MAALAAAAAVTILVPMWWDYPGPRAVPSAADLAGRDGHDREGERGSVERAGDARSRSVRRRRWRRPPRFSPPAPTAGNRHRPRRQNSLTAPNAAGTTPPAVPAAEYQLASDQAFSPSFASAGTAMFYQDERGRRGRRSFARAPTATARCCEITRIVDDPANNYHVRPSPDGKRIAFDSDRDGVRGVYVADGDGQHVRRVSGEGYAAVPSWSPDGETLAFVRAEPDKPKVWNLWTLQLESGQMRRITNYPYGQPWGGSWFPDGRRIAYSHEDRLIVRDLESGAERVFPTPIKGRLVRTPAVSPDGRRIVFQVERDGAWLLDFPAGTVRRVLDDPTAEEYTWAPDGKRLAYHSRRSDTWGVWVMASR